MKAVVFERFQQPLSIQSVPDPTPASDGVVVSVRATGICRSDWHGWMGHDDDIHLPHVPGHELAGEIAAVGRDVQKWRLGDRVTVPFSVGCGSCRQCFGGNPQVCDNYFQPGFTAWGSFAQFVAIPHADFNLVRLPDSMAFAHAATLGCRFVTSYRAIVAQGQVQPDQWVVVHGCGGVGLSSVMIATAVGARVIGVDISQSALKLAESLGATAVVDAAQEANIPERVRAITDGGADVSVDALGSTDTCRNSLLCLRKGGRHVQVGLMVGDASRWAVPMDQVIARELQIYGSHGIQASAYPSMFDIIRNGRLRLDRLVSRTVSLDDSLELLPRMDKSPPVGVIVIDRF